MNSTVCITGGSSGIGLALARLFARDGYDLILVALEEEALIAASKELRDTYGVEVLIFQVDLSRAGAAKDVITFLEQQSRPVDIFVNNAGFGNYAPFHETDLDEITNLVMVNAVALMTLSRYIYADMRVRGGGRIVNISSTVGFQPTPDMAVYSASKAFVSHLSLAMGYEARRDGSNVVVTTVYPYATRTGFMEKAHMKGHSLFSNSFTLSPDDVALATYKGVMKGKMKVVVPSVANLVFGGIYRFLGERGKMKLVEWGMKS